MQRLPLFLTFVAAVLQTQICSFGQDLEEQVHRERVHRLEELVRSAERAENLGKFSVSIIDRREAAYLSARWFSADHWRVRETRMRLDFANRLCSLRGDELRQAETTRRDLTRVVLLHQQRDYARALPLAADALARTEALHGVDSVAYFDALGVIATVSNWAREEPEKVLSLVRRKLALSNKLFRASHPNTILAQSQVGSILLSSEDFLEALPILRKAQDDITQRYRSDRTVAFLYIVITTHTARAHAAFEQFAEAYELLDKALVATADLADDEKLSHQSVVVFELGKVANQQGDTQGFIRHTRRSVELCKEAFGEDHRDYAVALSWYAYSLASAGKLSEAKATLAEAEKVAGQHKHDDRFWNVDITQARILALEGQLQSAADLYGKRIKEKENEHGANHPWLIPYYRGLADVREQQGDRNTARNLRIRIGAIKKTVARR